MDGGHAEFAQVPALLETGGVERRARRVVAGKNGVRRLPVVDPSTASEQAQVGEKVPEVELGRSGCGIVEIDERQVLSREQPLSHVWGYDFDPGSNVVDVYIPYLRKKLGEGVIETARGIGYRLKA